MNKRRNLSMLSDFYEFTMAYGYFESGMKDTIAVFDAFFRKNPDDGGFAIFAGLEDIVEYVENIHFDEEDIEYFRKNTNFSEEFLAYLKDFKFTGDIWAFPEGSAMFPSEPIITVKAPIIEAQILETYLLLSLNYGSLVATKTNRIVRAAKGRTVMEFGARRAQGPDASVKGARAAFIAGAPITSNTLSSQMYAYPAGGTMAHSWVQSFDSEYEAFLAYAKLYPNNCILLVDTYDVLKQGIPNAIKVFKEVLDPLGLTGGIRIDSGDIAYLSKEARKMLDDAGYKKATIVASNSLDEYKIESLLQQGAEIDSFGIGERLITAKSDPVFGGVYKLSQIEDEDGKKDKIKVSENVEKITTPGLKEVYRLYDKKTGKAEADYITLKDEEVDDTKPLVIFDPHFTWKMKRMENYKLRKMQIPIFEDGKRVYKSPKIEEINEYCKAEVKSLWDEVKRFDQPHNYYVDLSHDLWNLKQNLIMKAMSK
ncbi:nicotinate phosphoribosyltransferase [Anaerococcus sp. AGMB00486]|uniref:Nicotinate phosphoribosyltransferase n=2 Tax=Anaerococcus TaxID=165779 RepID=A0ABX2NBU3_9FIRM|nr:MULTISPECIES: nicotinate phosphoribosyltransferase [Anaerococcus]MSS78686.1 nicotinate phosphoribosyltransferase [Anaerococcus porci]NVF12186.1 nicotinate phosphoribosyltransferase [Anaerococcus faecalis]